jgi:hypothetical protein
MLESLFWEYQAATLAVSIAASSESALLPGDQLVPAGIGATLPNISAREDEEAHIPHIETR